MLTTSILQGLFGNVNLMQMMGVMILDCIYASELRKDFDAERAKLAEEFENSSYQAGANRKDSSSPKDT